MRWARASACSPADLPENREALEGTGFTFRRGDVADLADRLRFLIANPAVREAAGQAAKRRIREHYQWSKIASEIEAVYFDAMGWKSPDTAARKAVQPAVTPAASSQRKVG